MKGTHNLDELDTLFFEYITSANPKSNEDLKRYLQRHPRFREEIIEFTANYRALSIVDKVLPAAPPSPSRDRQLLHRAQARLRAMRRRHR